MEEHHLLIEEKEEEVRKFSICGSSPFNRHRHPHKSLRYWVVAFAVHSAFVVLTILILKFLYHSDKAQPKSQPLLPNGRIDHDAHLVGDIKCKSPKPA